MAEQVTNIGPPKDPQDAENLFRHIFCRLASYCTTAELYAMTEYSLSTLPIQRKTSLRFHFNDYLKKWAQTILEHAWMICEQQGTCPQLVPYSDKLMNNLKPLPAPEDVTKVLNAILLLQVTSSKAYSARTRVFLSGIGRLDENFVVSVLKHPETFIAETQKKAAESKQNHADKGKLLRMVGIGLGGIAGGVLVGVTGGLAAPLIGSAMASIMGVIGLGGTAAGLLASGLAGSSVICGTLFGVYGARSTASMVERHTREVRDLQIVPVNVNKNQETLGVRLCVSGWLSTSEDVYAPWTVFNDCDTYALQWEVESLKNLYEALTVLAKTQAMKVVKWQIIRQTMLAAVMNALTPVVLVNLGQIIDNPWMNAKALAQKAGAVLGDLLAKEVFGKRPITLTGYSLGSVVIVEALRYLATLHPANASCLIQDVFLYGTPLSADPKIWAPIRRVVAGRLVNGYATEDYILAFLSRASSASWSVAGLGPVDVPGIENVHCDHIVGHKEWRGKIGKSLQLSKVSGLNLEQVEWQLLMATDEAAEQAEAVNVTDDDDMAEIQFADLRTPTPPPPNEPKNASGLPLGPL